MKDRCIRVVSLLRESQNLKTSFIRSSVYKVYSDLDENCYIWLPNLIIEDMGEPFVKLKAKKLVGKNNNEKGQYIDLVPYRKDLRYKGRKSKNFNLFFLFFLPFLFSFLSVLISIYLPPLYYQISFGYFSFHIVLEIRLKMQELQHQFQSIILSICSLNTLTLYVRTHRM